jgi:hypothetical protein
VQKVVWLGTKIAFSELQNKIPEFDKVTVDMIKSA